MADLYLDQIAEGKPVRIEKDGKTIFIEVKENDGKKKKKVIIKEKNK